MKQFMNLYLVFLNRGMSHDICMMFIQTEYQKCKIQRIRVHIEDKNVRNLLGVKACLVPDVGCNFGETIPQHVSYAIFLIFF